MLAILRTSRWPVWAVATLWFTLIVVILSLVITGFILYPIGMLKAIFIFVIAMFVIGVLSLIWFWIYDGIKESRKKSIEGEYR